MSSGTVLHKRGQVAAPPQGNPRGQTNNFKSHYNSFSVPLIPKSMDRSGN